MYLAAHESKTSEERIFFPAILHKATTMCTVVRHILVHVHVSVKFYMWPLSCFGCKYALQCSLNMYCMDYTCVYWACIVDPARN